MNKFSTAGLTALAFTVLFLAPGCSDSPAGPNGANGKPTGILYLTGNIRANALSIDLSNGTVTNMFVGADPFRTPEGTFIAHAFEGLIEVSANGATKRIIVAEDINFPNVETFDDAFANPQLSPDGQYIVYEGTFGSTLDIHVVDRATGDLLVTFATTETGQGYSSPTWTPDGRIVMCGGVFNPGLYITDVNWTTLTRFDDNLSNPKQPAVSPDGKLIALIIANHLFTMSIDGSNVKQLTTSASAESYPSWSPDGKSIAVKITASILFIPVNGGSAYDLRTINSTFNQFSAIDGAGQMQWK